MAEEMRSSAGSMLWKGVNTLGAAAGIALGATALGVKANASHFNHRCGDNWNGYGYGHDCCGENSLVNRFEMYQSQRISELESQNVTDAKILDTYKALVASDNKQDAKFAQLTKELTDYVIENNRYLDRKFAQVDKETAINNQEIRDNLRFLDYKIDNNQSVMYNYVDYKTIPLEKKIGINQICPTPLAGCTPITTNAQVIETTPATTGGEVSLNTVKVSK